MSGALDELQQELGAVLAGLDAEAVQYRPSADGWSIQQIAEHLLRTYDLTLGQVEEQLLTGHPGEKQATARQITMQLAVTKLGYFTHGRRAPESLVPRAVLPIESGDAIFARMVARLSALRMIFLEAESAFGQKPCASHHVLGPMGVESWRCFHRVHGRHHIKQIIAIREELGSGKG